MQPEGYSTIEGGIGASGREQSLPKMVLHTRNLPGSNDGGAHPSNGAGLRQRNLLKHENTLADIHIISKNVVSSAIIVSRCFFIICDLGQVHPNESKLHQ